MHPKLDTSDSFIRIRKNSSQKNRGNKIGSLQAKNQKTNFWTM